MVRQVVTPGSGRGAVEPPAAERIAVITGAALGLGRSFATRLSSEVSGLLLVDINEEQLEVTARELARPGLRVATLVADVLDEDTPDRVMQAADVELGGADILINNAGIVPYAPFLETDRRFVQSLFALDVEAVYFMTQAFCRRLIERGAGGSIINLGTSHAIAGVGSTSAYAAAKGAIHALTRALAVELAPHGIRVNTLALGTTMTDRVKGALSASTLEGRMRQIPLNRGAAPDEAADAAFFLATAGYATGTELVLDGGFTIFGDN